MPRSQHNGFTIELTPGGIAQVYDDDGLLCGEVMPQSSEEKTIEEAKWRIDEGFFDEEE